MSNLRSAYSDDQVLDIPYGRYLKHNDQFDAVSTMLSASNNFTPDGPFIDGQDLHTVFVYGTLKTGHVRGDFLANQRYLGHGLTLSRGFRMLNNLMDKPSTSYPVLQRLGTKDLEEHGGGHIFGEVYQVTPDTVRTLDRIEHNGLMFIRKRYDILLMANMAKAGSTDMKKVVTVKAWVYVGTLNWWGDLDVDKLGTKQSKVIRMTPSHGFGHRMDDNKPVPYYNYNKSDSELWYLPPLPPKEKKKVEKQEYDYDNNWYEDADSEIGAWQRMYGNM